MEGNTIVGDGGIDTDSLLGNLSATRAKQKRWRSGWLVVSVFVLAILVAVSVGFIIGLTYSASTTNTVNAEFLVTSQDIGAVCAGALVKQSNFLTASGPAILSIIATIYDKNGVAIPPTSKRYDIAVPNELEIKDNFEWEAPSLPPDAYIRVIGADSKSIRAPAFSTTNFSVVPCDENGLPVTK